MENHETNNLNKIKEKEYEDFQESFELISQNIDYGIAIQNIEKWDKVEYINNKALEYLGCTLKEFKEIHNGNIFNFIYYEDKDKLKEIYKLAIANKKEFNYEVRTVSNKELQWISGKIMFANIKDRCIAINSFNNITQEKLMTNDLKISEERFRIAFSQTKDMLFDYNAKDKSIEFLYENNSLGLKKVVYNIPQSIIEKDIIEPQSIDDFMRFYQLVDSGVENATCIVKAKLVNGNIAWGKISIRSVYDENNRYIKGVGIIEDITSEKEIENKYIQEEVYRNAMLNEAIMVYEANVTENRVVRGFDYWKEEIDIANIESYEDIILVLAENVVHKDDRKSYLEHYLRNNILSKFNEGIDEINIEYRRLQSNGEYAWVSCTTHILRDPLTKDIVMFTYAKNINEQKLREISLKYQAERDLLTDLYNKKTTQKLITDIIRKSDNKNKHAFLIVDLDDFKSINDKYGHIFGDAILSEIGHKLKGMFRKNDIVGRIGGDEFVIFINDINSLEVCRKKASAICDMFRELHKGIDLFSPSGTVGISLYPKDGNSFFELYEKADASLYYAKELGKDRYFFYDKYIVGDKKKRVFNIDEELNIAKKNFRNNVIEYIFKILYHSKDLSIAIESVLKLVVNHFDLDRGYIFESSKDKLYLNNTFEYCINNDDSKKNKLQNIKCEDLVGYEKYFKEKNIYLENYTDHKNGSVKLRVQCAIRPKGDFIGFIGFDDLKRNRIPTNDEISTFQTIAEILGVFLESKRNEMEAVETVKYLENVMNNLNSFTYVINPSNNEIVFANKKTKEMFGGLKEGDKCYIKIKGLEEPCVECPVKKLSHDASCEKIQLFNEKYNVWSEATISYIKWSNNETVCLLNFADISNFKN